MPVDFPGSAGEDRLQHVSWDEWFEKFDGEGSRGLDVLEAGEPLTARRVAVVVITRDRVHELLHTLARLEQLPERPPARPRSRRRRAHDRRARDPELPGPRVLGFVACGAVVRRSPFLAAGGFSSKLGIGGRRSCSRRLDVP